MTNDEFISIFTNVSDSYTTSFYHDYSNQQSLNIAVHKNEHTFALRTSLCDFKYCLYIGPTYDSIEAIDVSYIHDVDAVEYKQIIGSMLMSIISYILLAMEEYDVSFAEFANHVQYLYNNHIDTDTVVDYATTTVWFSYVATSTKAPTVLELYSFFCEHIGSVALLLLFIKWNTIAHVYKHSIYYAPTLLAPGSLSFPILSKYFRQ